MRQTAKLTNGERDDGEKKKKKDERRGGRKKKGRAFGK